MIEIEKKAWVEDPEGLRTALTDAYGEPREIVKCDRYFAEPESVPSQQDPDRPGRRQVRLREEEGRAVATAKVRRMEGDTEINREIEFEVGDAEQFVRLITEYLDWEPLVDKRKETSAFHDGQATIELSRVGNLGWFLEVEILAEQEGEARTANEAIERVFRRFAGYLGPAEPRRYTQLLLEKSAQDNSQTEIR